VADTHVISLADGREIWIEPAEADEPDRQRITMRIPGGETVELESVIEEEGLVRWSVPPRAQHDADQ
jgi:hypothetical protein